MHEGPEKSQNWFIVRRNQTNIKTEVIKNIKVIKLPIRKKRYKIDYSYLEMESYLLPFNNFLTIDEKCELFSVKNRMINIPYNFSSKSEHKCE